MVSGVSLTLKCLSAADGTQRGCEHAMERSSARKREAIPPFVTTQMDPQVKTFLNSERHCPQGELVQ